jgi:hypothetical protein
MERGAQWPSIRRACPGVKANCEHPCLELHHCLAAITPDGSYYYITLGQHISSYIIIYGHDVCLVVRGQTYCHRLRSDEAERLVRITVNRVGFTNPLGWFAYTYPWHLLPMLRVGLGKHSQNVETPGAAFLAVANMGRIPVPRQSPIAAQLAYGII